MISCFSSEDDTIILEDRDKISLTLSDSQSKNTIQVNAFEVSPVEVDGSIQSRKHLLCQNLILLIGVIVAKRCPEKHNEAEPKC